MRSLFSAVSGLQNHQTRMDVIGNNVANVNTTGFKKGRVTFQDILSQTLSGAAKPTDERGGLNPRQVGLGMNVASIDTLMTQGNLQTTGKNTDLAITGEGFFVVNSGEQTYFTRAGNFMLDRNGTLVNSNGLRVQGWASQMMANGEAYTNVSGPLEDLVIPLGSKLDARATQNIRFQSNLNSDTPVLPQNATPDEMLQLTHTTSFNVYDDYGTANRIVVNFQKQGQNQWLANVLMLDPAGNPLQGVTVNGGNNQFLLNFNTDGTLLSVNDGNGNVVDNEGELMANMVYTSPDGVQRNFNMRLGEAGAVTDSITQFASPFTTRIYDQDGYTMGYLESFKIDDSGTITGAYDNGEKRELGRVALATFTNAPGLEKAGENLYVYSNNSGLPNIGAAGAQGRGRIYAGTLEMSNVDLSETFTDMIITERGFQANSRVVTTSDDMLREILSLKR